MAAGFQSGFFLATLASKVAGVRWGKSFPGASSLSLFATCFQRAGSGIVTVSHLGEGDLFFFPFRDLGLQLDKAVAKGCK